jgi:hypothetical protein
VKLLAKLVSALNPRRNVNRENAQWQFLSALCHPDLPVALRTEFCHRIPPHAFHDIACRTVFEEILAMSKGVKEQPALRDSLPARVTRRGFPDLDFDLLFSRAQHSGNAAAKETPEGRLARTYQALLASAASENRT